jgi:hypothetical protein
MNRCTYNLISDVCWDTMPMKRFQSWHDAPTSKLPNRQKIWAVPRKAIKDRLLLAGFSKAWSKRVEGTAQHVHA